MSCRLWIEIVREKETKQKYEKFGNRKIILKNKGEKNTKRRNKAKNLKCLKEGAKGE